MGPDGLVATAAYQPEPTAAAAARRFVRDTLQGWLTAGGAADGHGLVDDAVLLTSELVTNAVVHAGTAVQVTCQLCDGRVEVVVSDGEPARMVPEPPPAQHVPAERTSGRGLLLPAALASAWGVSYGRGAKAVWFRLGPAAQGLTLPQPGDDGLLAGDAAALAGALARAPVRAGAGVPAGHGTGAPAGHGTGVPAGHGTGVPAGHGTGVPPGWPHRQQPAPNGPGYEELLASAASSARATLRADAAYVLMADEDGDLRVRAAAGSQAWPSATAAGGAQIAGDGRADGPPSMMTVPFVVDGRVTGLLAVASAAPGRFGEEETTRLQRLADRWGPLLERAWLSELERTRRGRIAALAQARRLLGGGRGEQELLALVGEVVVPRLAPWCALLLPDGTGLRMAQVRHRDSALTGALGSLIEGAAAGIAAALADWDTDRARRWPLGAPERAAVPAAAAELSSECGWCFPLGADPADGIFAIGYPAGDRLPRELAELAADLACRIGAALTPTRLAGHLP